jgi:hypothetical protein
MTKTLTIVFLIAATTFICLWDVFVATNPVKGDTVSEIVLAFSFKHWFLPLVLGVVCGHLFWPVVKVEDKWVRLIVLWVIGALCFVLDLAEVFSGIVPILPFLGGLVLGHLLWPQSQEVKKYI